MNFMALSVTFYKGNRGQRSIPRLAHGAGAHHGALLALACTREWLRLAPVAGDTVEGRRKGAPGAPESRPLPYFLKLLKSSKKWKATQDGK